MKLGFGLMRLPRKLVSIDVEQTKKMVDLFIEAGGTYFDTAYVYPGSEEAARKALVERYPRESYTLATKLNAGMFVVAPNEAAAKKQFETSLERTGAGYFDYYLLHAFSANNYRNYDKFHLWDYVHDLKAKGLVKNIGFSFHDKPELLEQILTEHPEVDFVQLQINYADWEDKGVQSRGNYEVARAHNLPIVIMEPVKGGKLANPSPSVKELFDEKNKEMSYASWAIRFATSLDGILAVLSGMSNVEQMQDNLSYMKDFKPLDEEEREVIRKAQIILGKEGGVPCTSCHYCTPGCPKEIPIPEIFSALNKRVVNGLIEESTKDYAEVTSGAGKASDCIACGQCEGVCPQQISIIEQLKKSAELLEG